MSFLQLICFTKFGLCFFECGFQIFDKFLTQNCEVLTRFMVGIITRCTYIHTSTYV